MCRKSFFSAFKTIQFQFRNLMTNKRIFFCLRFFDEGTERITFQWEWKQRKFQEDFLPFLELQTNKDDKENLPICSNINFQIILSFYIYHTCKTNKSLHSVQINFSFSFFLVFFLETKGKRWERNIRKFNFEHLRFAASFFSLLSFVKKVHRWRKI